MINEDAAVFKTCQDSGNKGSQPRVSQLHPTALSWGEMWIQTSSETSMIEFPLVVSNRKIHVTLWNCWSWIRSSFHVVFFSLYEWLLHLKFGHHAFTEPSWGPHLRLHRRLCHHRIRWRNPVVLMGYVRGDTIRFVGNSSALENQLCFI